MRNGAFRKREQAARTMGQFIGLFLRRCKNHKDGTPGCFCVRFFVIEREGMKPRRVEIGLRTAKRKEAVERAAVLISGLLSTARLWLPDRVLNLLANTELPLWSPVQELGGMKRGRYSSKEGAKSLPPRGNVAGKPRA